MSTKSRILLSVLSSIVVSLVIAFIVFVILRGANGELQRIRAFGEIIDKTSGLHLLTVSYREGADRSGLRQGREAIQSLDALLKEIPSRAPREKVLIEQLQNSHLLLKPLIDQFLASGQAVNAMERERLNLLVSQILMKVQFISDDTHRLMDISQSRIISAQEKAGAMVVVLIIILALTNGAIYFLSGRAIVRAQEALRESEGRFRRYFELGVIGMAITSPTKGFIEVNDEICSILGYERAELLEKTWAELTHPDDLSADLSQFNRVMNGEIEGYTMDKRFIRKQGQSVDTILSVKASRRADGSIDDFVVLLQDITARKRAEEAVLESEKHFRALVEASSDVLYRMSPDWSEMHHLRSGQFLDDTESSRTWLQKYIHPDDQAHVTTVINKAIRNKSIFELEHRVLRVDGTVGWTFSRAIPLLDANGDIVKWFGAASDITQRKHAEEELRMAYSRLQTFFDHRIGGIGIVIANNKGDILQANDYYLNILGRTREELLSRQVDRRRMTPLEWLPADEKALAQLQERGVCDTYEKEYVRRDGVRVPVLITDAMMPGESGDILSFVLDITDRKRAEDALRESEQRYKSLNAELELRVHERTAELERKNQELQEFAFIASHDLAEPLRKIQTFGDLLKAKSADRLSEQERDYVSRMTGAANRMQELLDALLRYSRIETHGRDLVPVKLEDIAQTVTADLEVSIKKTGAHVEISPLPIINGDPYQWRQLFQNLIANAVKYYRSEVKPVVRIYGEENNHVCRIFIEDNGIGFDEKYLDKIFQPFQRLHGKHEYPGTGIGLAICQKIVERHKGTITARSTPGKGSTFIITLPIEKEK